MAPVDELVTLLNKGKPRDTVRELELLRSFGKDQLRCALLEAMGLLRREQGLTEFLYSKAGQRHLSEVVELKAAAKAAGFGLWPNHMTDET